MNLEHSALHSLSIEHLGRQQDPARVVLAVRLQVRASGERVRFASQRPGPVSYRKVKAGQEQ